MCMCACLSVNIVCLFVCLQGLADLYSFQQSNPTFDLDAVLSSQTKFYREYIRRGLRSIQEGQPAPKSESS